MANGKGQVADTKGPGLIDLFPASLTGFGRIEQGVIWFESAQEAETEIACFFNRFALFAVVLRQMPPALEWKAVHCSSPTS